ncbi:hypothetical protein BB558_004469 [Smittium angustum]|nr:hypothetical protein BB558_004469 [Smittium angustum]
MQSFSSKLRIDTRRNMNGDGFGIGWYDKPGENGCIFTSVLPAWSNINLHRIAEKVKSNMIFAHVRATTGDTATSESNCHPWQFGNLMWMHNGDISGFLKIKRKLTSNLTEDAYAFIQGTTDAEHAFAVFISQLDDPYKPLFSFEELKEAMLKTIALINKYLDEEGIEQPSMMNFAVTDGVTVVCTRYISSKKYEAASLYFSSGSEFRSESDGRYRMIRANKRDKSVVVASEPLTFERNDWLVIPTNTLLVITPKMNVLLYPVKDQHYTTQNERYSINAPEEDLLHHDPYSDDLRHLGDKDSPYEAVRANVSSTDDPTIPAMTFRVCFIAITLSVMFSFVNQFFFFRQNPISIGFSVTILLTFVLGKAMEKLLPNKTVNLFGIKSFSLNPGPFSAKEHTLLCVFTNAGSGVAYAIEVIAVQELFYDIKSSVVKSLMLIFSTQLLGYGLSGLVHHVLVKPAIMIWPETLVACSIFRTLHEEEEDPIVNGRRVITKMKFFVLVSSIIFFYQMLPSFFFQLLSSISILCFIFPNSIRAQQLGSGMTGLGMGSFSFDWSLIASYLGSPLSTPFWAAVNVFCGFVFFGWIIVPLGYYLNWFEAKKFPIINAGLFDIYGSKYNISKVTTNNGTVFNQLGYASYSPLRITFFFALNYGLALAIITAAITHVLLNNWPEFKRLGSTKQRLEHEDIHGHLMRRYKSVPSWWYIILFTASIAMGLLVCESKGVNLPWWGMFLAISVSAILLFPYGIVAAITNVSLGVNVISEFIAGLVFPGMPIANIVFKTYGSTTLRQALWITTDQKLGHYMKVPPRDMFIAQVSGSLISGVVNLITTKYLFAKIPNICQKSAYPWTCPGTNVFYSASVIWGLIGPIKMFGRDSIYNILLWGFLIGAVLPFIPWLLSKKYKKSLILRHTHIPIFLMACSVLPPAAAVEFPSWFIVAVIFNFIIYQRHHWWWVRYNYILSAALMTGTAICGVFIFYVFQINNISFSWWGNAKDFHCPLASKPLIDAKISSMTI